MLTKIDLRQMDLNLLPKFRAVYQRRSVSAAARDLFMTQSAVSNALAKMRQLFRDELFVRTQDGMIPTPLAHAIREAIEPALGLIEGGLENAGAFDPEQTARSFTIVMSQTAEYALLRHIAKAVLARAPHITIASTPASLSPVADDLRSGLVDLAVGIDVNPSPRQTLRSEVVGRSRFVGIIRAAHPKVQADGESILGTCAFVGTHESAANRQRGDWSRISASQICAADMLVVPSIVAETDLVGIVPEWIAARSAHLFDLVILENLLQVDPFEMSLSWHASSDDDKGHRWLRSVIAEAAVSTGFVASSESVWLPAA